MIPQADIDWNKKQHALIRNGGTWSIPRSGLIMERTPEGFKLLLVMPFSPAMAEAAKGGMDVPKTAADLLDWQRADFNAIRVRFEAAGLTFTDPKGLLS